MDSGDIMDTDSDDLTAGTFQEVKHELVSQKRTTFMPWHKPRKQWLRVHQWCAEVTKLILLLKDKQDTISYLSLPGSDLLDIRILHDLCKMREIKLKYLGYNSIKETEVERNDREISESEVSRLPYVDSEKSHILPDNIENVAKNNSTAFESTKNAAPFDIVNIDLCGSVGNLKSGSNTNIFDSIASIISMQKKETTSPWIMFLTTRSSVDTATNTVVAKFLELIQKNCIDHSEFLDKLEESTGIDPDKIQSIIDDIDNIDNDSFQPSFVIGLVKWILDLTNGSSPKWSTTMLESYCYDIYGGKKDMISYAFLFQLQHSHVEDTTLLATQIAESQPQITEEKDQAMLALDMVKSMKDVDELLASNSQHMELTVVSSRKLLETARYDGEAYNKWVADNYPKSQ